MEDLLQDNVKACISDFREAGIKVWMLTGDKGDTAHQIAYSCGLYSHESDFKVFRIEDEVGGKNPDTVIDQMSGLKDEAKYGVTISATTLVNIMAGEDGKVKGERALKMLKIIDKSRAIVVYRCSPGQKA
jgi:magnesium-transporting ATPase (P-type)